MNQERIAKDCCGEQREVKYKYLKILDAVYHLADARFNLQQLLDDIVGATEQAKKDKKEKKDIPKFLDSCLGDTEPSLLNVIINTPSRIYDEAKQINSIISDIRGAIL